MTSILTTVTLFALQSGTTGGPALPGEATAAPATGVSDATGAAGGAAAQGSPPFDIFWIFIPVLVVMILFSVFGQRKERKRRAQLLASIEKHDKVQTAGGIIGHVVEVKPETVTLKVDETSNLRITFAKSFVTEVLDKSTSST